MTFESPLKELVEDAVQRQANDIEDANAKLMASIYTNALNYTNIIILGAYAAYFTVWSNVSDMISTRWLLLSCLLMIVSVTGFVLFEVYKMIYTSRLIMKRLAAASSETDPRMKLAAVEQANIEHVKIFGKIWYFVLIVTIPTGLISAGILLAAISKKLLQEIL